MIKPNETGQLLSMLSPFCWHSDEQFQDSEGRQAAITHYPDLKFQFFHIVLHFPSLATWVYLVSDYTLAAFIAPCKTAKQITYLDLSIPVVSRLTLFLNMFWKQENLKPKRNIQQQSDTALILAMKKV